MKRFRFRLERVHRVREAVRKIKQVALARERMKAIQEEQRLASIVERVNRAEERIRVYAGGTFEVGGMVTASKALRSLERQERAQEEVVEAARRRVEEARQELLKARKDARVLERLKERRLARHTVEAMRAEQDSLDDIGALRWLHRSRCPQSVSERG